MFPNQIFDNGSRQQIRISWAGLACSCRHSQFQYGMPSQYPQVGGNKPPSHSLMLAREGMVQSLHISMRQNHRTAPLILKLNQYRLPV
jgi:hypothetical protein